MSEVPQIRAWADWDEVFSWTWFYHIFVRGFPFHLFTKGENIYLMWNTSIMNVSLLLFSVITIVCKLKRDFTQHTDLNSFLTIIMVFEVQKPSIYIFTQIIFKTVLKLYLKPYQTLATLDYIHLVPNIANSNVTFSSGWAKTCYKLTESQFP